MALAKKDEVEVVVIVRSKTNPQRVVTSSISQDIHVFNRFDNANETTVVADEAESTFLKTEAAVKEAYGKFMNLAVDSANEETTSPTTSKKKK